MPQPTKLFPAKGLNLLLLPLATLLPRDEARVYLLHDIYSPLIFICTLATALYGRVDVWVSLRSHKGALFCVCYGFRYSPQSMIFWKLLRKDRGN